MRRLAPAVTGGALGALIASLVSLPLDSPDDLVFNTFTVTLGSLAAGLALGGVWWVLPDGRRRVALFAGACAASVALAAIAALAMEALFEGSLAFVLPLAAIVFASIAVVAPVASAAGGRVAAFGGPALVVAAVAAGVGLMGQGDEESGRLELPEAGPTPAAASVVSIDDVSGVEFHVVPGESQGTYTVREKLASMPATTEAVGRTTAFSGVVRLDGTSTITVDLSTLESDQGRRDAFVRERIFNEDPVAVFTLDPLADLPQEYREGQTIAREVTGTMTIRGVERPLPFLVEARLEGDTLHILGRTDFRWADFQIDPPNTPLVTVEDTVHIEALIVARRGDGGT